MYRQFLVELLSCYRWIVAFNDFDITFGVSIPIYNFITSWRRWSCWSPIYRLLVSIVQPNENCNCWWDQNVILSDSIFSGPINVQFEACDLKNPLFQCSSPNTALYIKPHLVPEDSFHHSPAITEHLSARTVLELQTVSRRSFLCLNETVVELAERKTHTKWNCTNNRKRTQSIRLSTDKCTQKRSRCPPRRRLTVTPTKTNC